VKKRKKTRRRTVSPTTRPMLTVEKSLRKIEKLRKVDPPKLFIMKVGEGDVMTKAKK